MSTICYWNRRDKNLIQLWSIDGKIMASHKVSHSILSREEIEKQEISFMKSVENHFSFWGARLATEKEMLLFNG